jgi:hypothetical protein
VGELPIPADIAVTIGEIAEHFVSGVASGAAANRERSHVRPGSVTGVVHDVTEPDIHRLKF